MDRLDRYAGIALLILLACMAQVGYRFQKDAKDAVRSAGDPVKQAGRADGSTTPDPRVRVGRDLLEAGNIAKAEVLLQEIVKSNPFDAEPYLLLGDLKMRMLDPIAALAYYREAIDLNPDYLDKKTPSFQGKKIKIAVEEARGEIEKRLGSNPGDGELGKARKTLYYLLRRIAGTCG